MISQSLKFVIGAVSKKDLVPELTHFQIKGSRVTGFNGRLCLSSPIDCDLDCCPRAEPFVAAVNASTDETVQLTLAKNGKVLIRAGKFRAYVDTIEPDAFPDMAPEGQSIDIHGPLLPALRTLYDFTAEDASRPWAAGILFAGGTAIATNNIIIAQYWLGHQFPFVVNIPRFTILEMLRIGEEPISIQMTASSITFHYEGARWLRSQLHTTEWPDVSKILDALPSKEEVPLIPKDLAPALEQVAPFLDSLGTVLMDREGISTSADEDGAHVTLEGLYFGAVNHKMLRLVMNTADRIGFDAYPKPLPFYGKSVRGAIATMRRVSSDA